MNKRVQLPMFLLAFAMAITIKFTVHEAEQVTERVIEAQVTYTSPADDIVSYNRVDKVKVGLRGKGSEIAKLTLFNVQVVVDVPEGHLGPTDINLTPANVRTAGELEVISIVPNSFTIQVEPRLDATIPIAAELIGEPAAGARHGEPIVRPKRARVSGPESQVRKVRELEATVRLDGHARTFTDTVLVVSPNDLVQVIEPTFVEIEVPMEEPELSITFENLIGESSGQ